MLLYRHLQDRQTDTQQNDLKGLGPLATPGPPNKNKTKQNRVSPREWVMTSEAKYAVSQFWNLSEFRLNSGGEPASGLVLSRDG